MDASFIEHFYSRGRNTIRHNIGIARPSRTITPSHHPLGGTPDHPKHNK